MEVWLGGPQGLLRNVYWGVVAGDGSSKLMGKGGWEAVLHRDKVVEPRLEVKFSNLHIFADAAPSIKHTSVHHFCLWKHGCIWDQSWRLPPQPPYLFIWMRFLLPFNACALHSHCESAYAASCRLVVDLLAPPAYQSSLVLHYTDIPCWQCFTLRGFSSLRPHLIF